MRPEAVGRLALADLSLGRTWAGLSSVAAATGAGLVVLADRSLTGFGLSLVLCVLIGQCFQLPVVSVVQELTQGTRAYILAQPVTPAEYAASKLLSGGLLFLAPAVALVVALAALPAEHRLLPIPLVVLVLLAWLVLLLQTLGLALVTGSMGVTIGALVTQLFIIGNGSASFAAHSPSALRLWGQLETGGPTRLVAFALFGAELLLTVGATLLVMSRKERYI
jgi:hypothetical protein